MLTRLERTLYRLEAQHACLQWAFDAISGKDGVVFEIGLGHGRTYHHLRHHLPDRDMYVFDREVNSYPDCTPPEEQLVVGEVAETLPRMAAEQAGRVVMANSDIGSFDKENNKRMAQLISTALPPALAKGGIVLSDLPLSSDALKPLPLPPGAREDRYYIYEKV